LGGVKSQIDRYNQFLEVTSINITFQKADPHNKVVGNGTKLDAWVIFLFFANV
jgi:hypothetical protein